MKNIYFAPVLLLAVLLPAGLTARLGDTELQCETRYGKPVSGPSTSMSTAPFTRRYKFDGWIIEATFVNRRVAKHSYNRDITVKQTGDAAAAYPAILQAEAGSGKWQSSVIGPPVGYQDGIDAKAGRWRNSNGRKAYVDLMQSLIVEEKGFGDTAAPASTPKKLPNF